MTLGGRSALPEDEAADFDAIRADHHRRLIEAMAAAGLDALVLGRPNDVAFATGVRALFTTGSRPFTPACVVVGERVHVLADHDEGVPAEIPHGQIFGRAWNPVNAAASVAGIPGLAEAKRIGSAGSSRRVTELLGAIAPDAEIVDARALVQQARSPKSPAEVAVVETACALAEAGLAAMRRELRPGVTTRHLVARYAERLGELGVTLIPDGFVARRTALGISAGFDDDPLADGELVSLSPSVTYGGYDATLARTYVTGGRLTPDLVELRHRTERAVGAVVAACIPGATGAALLAAWTDTGERSFDAPLAHGIGIGVEEPIVGMGVGAGRRLAAGMVLAVQGWCTDDRARSWHHRDLTLVTAAGPRRLTRHHGEAST